jgi:hypothetical protein
MDWVADLALKRRNGHSDARALTTKADALWGGLKRMLESAYNLYNDSFPPVANGEAVYYDDGAANAPFVRRRRINAQNQPGDEIARVTISFNSPVVTATYSDGRSLLLIMGRDDKGYVAILYNGTPVSLDRAAEIILRPFLFPELPQ